MRISKNYTLEEFKRSATADRLKIKNTIPSGAINSIRILVDKLLQPINDATGWKNLISSGYRSAALNRAVGGVNSSQHRLGEAADCKFYSVDENGRLYTYIAPIDVAKKVLELGLEFDQMILYPTFVHLSFTNKRKNRQQVLYNRNYTGKKL